MLALEDTVRQLKSTTDEQKRQIEQLEAQKIDMKLDFDTQIFSIQKNFSHDASKAEEVRFRRLEQHIEKLSREREELSVMLRRESEQAIERFKNLSEQMHKSDERSQQLHERIQTLEKENSALIAQVSKYKSEMHQKEQQAESYQQ